MAYTFSALKSKLMTQIGDPNLDSSIAGDALNYTQQEILNKFELTLNSGYQSNSVVAGTNTLATALPTDLQRITALYDTVNGKDLTDKFLSNKEFRRMFPKIDTTNQLGYWTFFTEIEFSTLADQDYTLRIEYVKTADFLANDSDVPVIPQAFEEMLMLGAKMRVYEQKEDFDYANQFVNRFADLEEQFVDRYATRQVDGMFVAPGSRRISPTRTI